ncbi:hypothetical protein MBM_08771 [Drepanopeziza brunnea f. sp. 'multigermtubi' MB_m1]|uniref:Uncharacterized protein n=1 Tax=Marssonina brunnea f. sp. multigermtubi (strain MB_m1) TaxID=1072389 RepID=K1XKL1_MARBU|nr:uncharacterized protein MBM_08771 [Drepanopeziza brunnea f. sp. 'multigermtubi' MB_m1]EKD13009.1 hypothetical protein MBM_08771 [Drepanopeziza brunnea f. sp. 'multigermtubi' MB_m1]
MAIGKTKLAYLGAPRQLGRDDEDGGGEAEVIERTPESTDRPTSFESHLVKRRPVKWRPYRKTPIAEQLLSKHISDEDEKWKAGWMDHRKEVIEGAQFARSLQTEDKFDTSIAASLWDGSRELRSTSRYVSVIHLTRGSPPESPTCTFTVHDCNRKIPGGTTRDHSGNYLFGTEVGVRRSFVDKIRAKFKSDRDFSTAGQLNGIFKPKGEKISSTYSMRICYRFILS